MTSSTLPRLSNRAFLRSRFSILLALLLFGCAAFPLSRFALTASSQKGAVAISAAFTSGNVVIYRVGSGTGSLVNTGNPVFLDEYTPAGTFVQSIPLPTTVSGSNKQLIASGTSSSEGLLTRSTDGQYLVLTGYASDLGGAANLTGTSSATIPRTVGRVSNAGAIDTTTALTDFATGNSPRSAVSDTGTNLWVAGGAGGARYTTLGATTSTQLSTTTVNLRQINIFGDFNGTLPKQQLYVSAQSGTTRVAEVGDGVPTTSGQTITNIPGIPTVFGTSTTNTSPYSFFFADLDAGVAGVDTLYVADDNAAATGGGIQKYSLVSGTWVAKGTITAASPRGLTGVVSGSSVTLYATTGGTTATGGGSLYSFTDTTGYNATVTGTMATIASAGANTAFRGVAPAPVSAAATPTPTPTPTPNATPTLSVTDVTQAEGNAGTTTFTFTVNLSAPAGAGGVTFDIATQDNTATVADNDYVAKTELGRTIAAGLSSATFTVTVNGDTTIEPNETFFVNVTNVVGSTVTDPQGVGTITNDDLTLTPIYTIQGSGNSSPFLGQSVTTRGIVTGRKGNGYFIQDATGDGNTNTSDALFVFTSSTPSGVAVGDSVQVTGTVAEFIAATSDEPRTPTDPRTATELTGSTVSVLSTGNPLPAALDAASLNIFNPASPSRSAELEKYEYMRVSVSSLTVSEPTNNNVGEFWGVLTGTPRPFREPGIEAGDPVPPADQGPYAGATPPAVPVFDGNFERIQIDSDDSLTSAGARRSALFVTTGAIVTGIVGPLDYAFDNYRIVLDATVTPGVTPGITAAVPVPVPSAQEFTISHANLQNFGVSNAGFAGRLNKASLAIRNVMRTPDVVGMIEIFDLTTLQQLATKINNDAGNPAAVNYVAYLDEGVDGGGDDQDIGYLVNTARVTVIGTPTQYHKGTTFIYCGVTSTLHDRPSYVLNVTFPQPGGGTVPVTVILNHTKSLIATDSPLPFGSCGTGTEGARNREKRRLQSEDIADLIQTHAAENLVVLGDLNAFDFNDGLTDVVGTLKGTPAPPEQVVEPSTDRWTYQLTNLITKLPASERYSFAFEGNAQALDHILVNNLMLARNTRFAYGRYNGDFSVDYAADTSRPERLADHDAAVSYFAVVPPAQAGQVIISEFRFRGPSAAVAASVAKSKSSPALTRLSTKSALRVADTSPEANNEFIEFYNNTDSNITVATVDGSAGWSLVASDGVARFTIPNGTVIPARGHFLATNSLGYSLGGYPSGNNGSTETFATGDITYATDIPDQSGIAIFNTADPASFNTNNRLDAVGYSAAPALYREGAGFNSAAAGAETSLNIEYSFYRDMVTGLSADSNDNVADFRPADTQAFTTTIGTRLGAPGPENLRSPVLRTSQVRASLLDPQVGSTQPPNRVRKQCSDPTVEECNPGRSQFGTLSIRRVFTNSTSSPVTRLRFRVVDITTFPRPDPNTAEMRVLSSGNISVTITGGGAPVPVKGTTLEEPPSQPNGGGWNSTLTTGTVTFATPLAPGAAVNLQFLLGVQQTGSFRFLVIVEALP